MLEMHFLRAPAVREFIEDYFDDYGVCAGNPGPAARIYLYMGGGLSGWHGDTSFPKQR